VVRPRPGGRSVAVTGFASQVTDAYDATGDAWAAGPARVYDRLADALVARSPVPLAGRTVLDLGAGTGAAGRALGAAGATVLAVDRSAGMLGVDRNATRGRAVVADATALPVADGAVDGAVAAFSFNHLPDPARGLAEARRACRPGSPVLAAAYADDDTHPAKDAVERAIAEAGWRPAPWYRVLRDGVVAQLATPARMAEAAGRAGLAATTARVAVPVPGLAPADLVAWRLGMAQVAPFVATLGPAERTRVTARALALLGSDPPPLVRSVVVLAAVT